MLQTDMPPLAGDTRFATSVIMAQRLLQVREDIVDTVDDDAWRAHMPPQPVPGRRRAVRKFWI